MRARVGEAGGGLPGAKQAEKVQHGNWHSCPHQGSEMEGTVAKDMIKKKKTLECLHPAMPLLGISVQ